MVQSTGWRRLSMMAADAGDTKASREAFQKAQRLTPDDPDVAVLEVTTLLGAGDRERAAERAAFHARRLARLPQTEDLANGVALLERLGRGEFPPLPGLDDDGDPSAGGRDRVGVLEPDSPFHQLQAWAQGLPPPQLRLNLSGATPQDLGALVPAVALAAPLARWRKTFGVQLPQMAWQTLRPEALGVFVDERWSDLLRRDPRLADCFEVLDGLIQVLDLVPMGLAASLQALQQLPQAAKALQGALQANAHVAALLTARRAPRLPEVTSYAIGSVEQARICVHPQHDLWRDVAVQHWLKRQLQPEVSPGLFDDGTI